MTSEEIQIRTMNIPQLIAFHNILVMQKRAGVLVTDDPGRVDRHLGIVNKILNVKPADALKRLNLPANEFKIAADGENLGNHVILVVSRDGEVWQVATRERKEVGTVLNVPYNDYAPDWKKLGFEAAKRIDNAPPHIVADIWKK